MFKEKLQELLQYFLHNKDPKPIEDLIAEHTQQLTQGLSKTYDADATQAFDASQQIDNISSEMDSIDIDNNLSTGRRYTTQYELGVGGMASVWKVRDQQLLRSVALKRLHRNKASDHYEKENFIIEAQITAQLQHPGIVPIHDIHLSNTGEVYFTMSEIKGQTLQEIIRSVHQASSTDQWKSTYAGWSIRRIIDTIKDICTTLAYAHSRGVIHQDLKPTNIMIGEYGEVLLVDWGIAKICSLDEENDDWVKIKASSKFIARKRESISGTPNYMAPEQVRGEYSNIDGRSDVYAMGIILFELLTEQKAFVGNTPEILRQKVKGISPSIADALQSSAFSRPVPIELQNICTKAMQPSPENRYNNAKEMVQDIQDWLDGAQQEEQARHLLASISEKKQAIADIEAEIDQCRHNAGVFLQLDGAHSPEAWENWKKVQDLYEHVQEAKEDIVQLSQGAILHAPHLPEIYQNLIEVEYLDYLEAMMDSNHSLAKKIGKRLELYIEQIPPIQQQYWANVRKVDLASLQSKKKQSISIKRNQVQDELNSLLGITRWLSIVGIAGVGKTHIAWQVATEWCKEHKFDMVFCDVAECPTIPKLLQELANKMHISLVHDNPQQAIIQRFTEQNGVVLFLDNAENLPDDTGDFLELLLYEVSSLHIIITSRKAFQHPMEAEYKLPPMSLLEGIELFVQHGKKRIPNWQLDENNRETITNIVQKLDLIPLGVELAGAKLAEISVEAILEKLEQRFSVLSTDQHGSDSLTVLDTALSWSCEMLSPTEKRLLHQLSVFSDRFTLQMVEDILPPMQDTIFSNVLEALVDDNLVHREYKNGKVLYSLLKSVREFASKQLSKEEQQLLWQYHAEYFARSFQEAITNETPLYGSSLTDNITNFILASRKGKPADALTCCVLAIKVINQHGPMSLGLDVCRQFLERSDIPFADSIHIRLEELRFFRKMGLYEKNIHRLIGLVEQFDALYSTKDLPSQKDTSLDRAILETEQTIKAETVLFDFLHPKNCTTYGADQTENMVLEQIAQLETYGEWDKVYALLSHSYPKASAMQQTRILRKVIDHLTQTGSLHNALCFAQELLGIQQRVQDTTECTNTLIEIAVLKTRLGQSAPAIEQYKKALHLAEAQNNTEQKARIIANMGILYQSEGQNDEALQQYKIASELFAQLDQEAKVGAVYGNIGTIYQLQHKLDDAIACFDKARNIAQKHNNAVHYGVFTGNQGYCLAQKEQFDRAQEQLQEAIRICDTHLEFAAGAFRGEIALLDAKQGKLSQAIRHIKKGEPQVQNHKEEYGKFLCRKAEVYYIEGTWQHCKEAVLQAKNIATELEVTESSELWQRIIQIQRILPADIWLSKEEQQTMRWRGLIHKEQGEHALHTTQYTKALHYFEKAKILFANIDDHKLHTDTLLQIAVVYSHNGRLPDAIRIGEECKEIYKQGDRTIEYAHVLNMLGGCYRRKNQLELALRYHDEALVIMRMVDPLLCISVLEKAGLCCQNLGRYEQALEYLEEALDIATSNKMGTGTLLCNVGLCHNLMGNQDLALNFYRRGVKILREKGDRNRESIYLGNIALLYTSQSKFSEAEAIYQDVIRIAQQTNIVANEVLFEGNYGDMLIASHRVEEAIPHLLRSIELAKEEYPAAREVFLTSLAYAYALHNSLDNHIELALQTLQEVNLPSMEKHKEEYCKMLCRIAMVHLMANDRTQALVLYEEIKQIYIVERFHPSTEMVTYIKQLCAQLGIDETIFG